MCQYIFTHKTLKTNSPTTESNYPITASETDRTNAEQVSQDAGNPPLLDNICTQTTRVQQVWVFWEITLFTTLEQIQCISYKWQTISDRYRFLMKNRTVLLWLIFLANETHGIAQVFCFPHDKSFYLHNAFLQSMLFQSSFIENSAFFQHFWDINRNVQVTHGTTHWLLLREKWLFFLSHFGLKSEIEPTSRKVRCMRYLVIGCHEWRVLARFHWSVQYSMTQDGKPWYSLHFHHQQCPYLSVCRRGLCQKVAINIPW